MAAATKRSQTSVAGFKSREMDFQLIRQLGATAYGGASIGECLAVVQQITDASPDSWIETFARLAGKQYEDAGLRHGRGHLQSARDQFLRAANSFRAAEYYAWSGSEEAIQYGLKSRDSFQKAIQCTDLHFKDWKIPYENVHLPAYFLAPRNDGIKRKTIIVMSGFDGSCEESYFQAGAAGLERDYNVVLFAGPGQVDSRRFYPDMTFIPDFERPVGALLDFLLECPEIDSDRLALYGISFGGYFTLRATVHDSRIKALIANSPIIDLHAYMCGFLPFDPSEIPDEEDFTPGQEPAEVLDDENYTLEQQRLLFALSRRFGQNTFKKTYQRLKDFKVEKDHIKRIKCPCLGMVGAGEGDEPQRQAGVFKDNTAGPTAWYSFTVDEGADTHCQLGNLSLSCAVVYDWLDETFAPK